MPYGHLIAGTVMILGVCQGHSASLYTDKHVAWCLCHCRASCNIWHSWGTE